MADAPKYKYYRHDGAEFRGPADAPGPWIAEVLHGDQWVPYEGDRVEPVWYGNQIEDPLAGR